MASSIRSWLKLLGLNILVSMVLFVLAMLGIEAYLRLTIPASSGGSLFESTLTTRRYKVMKPNARIVAWGSELRTNNLGFRDQRPAIPPKPASGYRVVVLGDSFTVSGGVDFDHIYTSLLDDDLKQRLPGTEVINLAVGGYNIIQYELVLNEVALGLQPDMVVVAVFPFNDLSNDTYRANFDDASGRSEPPVAPSWYQGFYVYGAFLKRVEGRVRGWFQAGPPPTASPGTGVGATDAEENLAALTRLVKTATENNLEVMIVLLPNTDTFEAQRRDFAPFESLCRDQRWSCVNLLDRFIASGDKPSALRLNLLDSHPNNLYNARVAQYLAGDLAARISASRH